MNKKHLKSVCCGATIICYGGKRRQCVSCKRTWTIRPKKRGRKKFRAAPGLIERYLSGSIKSIRFLAKLNDWNRDRAQQMVLRSLKNFVEKNKNDYLLSLQKKDHFIAIADAMWHRVRGEKTTLYLIILRPVESCEATVMLPVFFPGHETSEGWEYAWNQIPKPYKQRICALICDGQRWLLTYGYNQDWVVQRCQFHLLANLQMYLGIKDRQRNSKVIQLVKALFATADQKQSRKILDRLAKIRKRSKSRGICRVLSGLETNHQDFQSYLRYPKLNLPATTNTAESYIGGIRELMRRSRGFRSQEKLSLWITGYVLFKRTIHCNGKNQQKKTV
jgi:hypothetical protein